MSKIISFDVILSQGNGSLKEIKALDYSFGVVMARAFPFQRIKEFSNLLWL